MNRHLFIYGTLRSSYLGQFGSDKRDRLHRECQLIGPAQMAGRLYDLGRYPGVVDSAEPDAPVGGHIVHGEVVELADPRAAFGWLDAYEGIVPDNPGASEYRRELRTIVLLDAAVEPAERMLAAWVYIYNRDLAGARLVPGGNWEV